MRQETSETVIELTEQNNGLKETCTKTELRRPLGVSLSSHQRTDQRIHERKLPESRKKHKRIKGNKTQYSHRARNGAC